MTVPSFHFFWGDLLFLLLKLQMPADDNMIEWPSLSFKSAIKSYFEVMLEIGKTIVRALARYHNAAPEIVEPLFDLPQDQLRSPYSASVARCYNYFAQDKWFACKFHEDLSCTLLACTFVRLSLIMVF